MQTHLSYELIGNRYPMQISSVGVLSSYLAYNENYTNYKHESSELDRQSIRRLTIVVSLSIKRDNDANIGPAIN